ncbi:MAG TPA: DUF4258 domain-containing protein [Pyrinomonadaceae bacterium]|jgi:hypothetical protein|nr:DUF4258 domain-containing protein [Pyrinomonadaceae bacterium]
MFEAIRDKMREKIRRLEYVMTIHAEEEMENDGFSIFDVENCILTGEIVERQKDRETDEWKYLSAGKTLDDTGIVVVAKLSLTDKLVIITVYFEDYEY